MTQLCGNTIGYLRDEWCIAFAHVGVDVVCDYSIDLDYVRWREYVSSWIRCLRSSAFAMALMHLLTVNNSRKNSRDDSD